MVEQLTTIFIIGGGLVGVLLGLYGVAPSAFGRRRRALASRRDGTEYEDYQDDDDYEAEDRLSGAYGLLVDARRRSHGLFGLPNAWQESSGVAIETEETEAPTVDPLLLQAPTGPVKEPVPAFNFEAPATTPILALEIEPRKQDPEDQGDEGENAVLDIFREVLPDNRTFAGRARANVIDSASMNSVSLADLLADARLTVRVLLTRPEEVRSR